MARYKAIVTSPRFLAVDLEKQLLPGSFEYAVHHLLEREFDLSIFDTRRRNDRSVATAHPPGMLFKVILCAYAQHKTRTNPDFRVATMFGIPVYVPNWVMSNVIQGKVLQRRANH